MPDKLFLAYDVGTTNQKTALVDEKFNILGMSSGKYPVHIPKKNYAEQDPLDWWHMVTKTTNQLRRERNLHFNDIAAIVFSGQALSTVLIDKNGEPLMNSMIWMDARAAKQAKELIGSGLIKISGYNLFTLLKFLRITKGGPGLAGKDVIPRILWLKENMPDIYKECYKILDCNGYMIYKTTGEAVMSRFDANLSWMMDTRRDAMNWSESILGKCGIDKRKLPEIKPSTSIAGTLRREAAHELNLPEGIPVIVGAGDIPCAAVGSSAVKEREFFVYIGTSDFMGAHIRERDVDISHYMGSLCSAIPDMYLYTGEQESAGSCLDWVKNEFFRDAEKDIGGEAYLVMDDGASRISAGSEGLMFAPWMGGEKTPVDDPFIRGGFQNLSLEHTRDHVTRAVLEGVALNIRWAFRCMEKKIGEADYVNFSGGGAKSRVWCQIAADVLNREVRQVENPAAAGVRGAAMIAAVGLGVYKNFSAAARRLRISGVFEPNARYARLYDRLFLEFQKLYKSTKGVCKDLNARST